MKIAVLQKPCDIELREVEAPKLVADFDVNSVLVKVRACAISGTDLRIYRGIVRTKYPIILGQEFSGVVEDYGEEVENISKGERVVIEPVVRCGKCSYCKIGLYTLCDNVRVLGVNADGGLAEYVKVPEYAIHRIHNNLSLEEASLTVPVAVALYAIKRAHVGIGDNVVVFGAGAIGLSALQLARLSGADKVAVIEPVASKRKLAEKLGAYETFSPKEITGESMRKDLGKINVVIETSGSVDALHRSINIADKKGRIVVVGAYGKEALLPTDLVVRKDLTILGSWLYPHVFQEALSLIAKRLISVKEYVSSKYPLIRIKDAFEEALKPETIRVLIDL